MKKFIIDISQNGWEYTGFASIVCKEIKKIDSNKVEADGIVIEFDEEIGNSFREVEASHTFKFS